MIRRTLLRIVLALIALCLVASPPARAQQAVRLRAVLVLDASGSMAANDPQRLVRVAAKMLADLADERDHITVISFGTSAQLLKAAPGSQHDALRAAIDTLGRSEACTDYGQALEAATKAFTGKAPAGERRVVLFLTDGKYEPARPTAGCDDYERGDDTARETAKRRVEQAAEQLRQSGARLFTIGLGSAPTRAGHSAALLRSAAGKGGGKFLHAQSARDVPRIFAGIFGALVGSPVLQDRLQSSKPTVIFDVPKGADRLHVVLVPQNPSDLSKVGLTREGKGGGAVSFEPARVETGTSSGYQLARVLKDASGRYTLTSGGSGPIEVLVLPDVGLSLRIEGIPKVLPEHDKLKGMVALRTRLGDEVKLTSEYLQDVVFTVSMGEKPIFDQAPSAKGEAKFGTPRPLPRGEYVVAARASHKHGLLDVAPVEFRFKVMPQFEMKLAPAEIRFDTMAEEGLIPLKPSHPVPIEVVAPAQLPTDITLELKLPKGRIADDLQFEPATLTFGPNKPRRTGILLSLKEPDELRGDDVHYQGELQLVAKPEHARLLTGAKQWSVPIDGKLRSWTLGRYFEEYKWELGIGLLVLLLLIWIIGRVVAAKFPKKARIHYVAVGEQFESDSLIKRRAKHGAYRSARFHFPLGKKAKPLVTFRAKGTRFEVIPERRTVITILDDAIDESEREKRKPFAGRWRQRYRLGDRYEVWLTRA